MLYLLPLKLQLVLMKMITTATLGGWLQILIYIVAISEKCSHRIPINPPTLPPNEFHKCEEQVIVDAIGANRGN